MAEENAAEIVTETAAATAGSETAAETGAAKQHEKKRRRHIFRVRVDLPSSDDVSKTTAHHCTAAEEKHRQAL
jgi:hypothetical protein